MSLLIVALIFMCICYKYGDWRNWKSYYPTILFYIIGNSIEHIVTNKKELWDITCIFDIDVLGDMVVEFLIYPSIIILFLSRYPKTLFRQIIYISSFISILALIEFIGFKNHQIEYHNGWNIIWTILLYFGMFVLFVIHNRKPILAWIIFFALVGGGMLWFNIPITEIKK